MELNWRSWCSIIKLRVQKLKESSNFSFKFRVIHNLTSWILFNDNLELSELKMIYFIYIYFYSWN